MHSFFVERFRRTTRLLLVLTPAAFQASYCLRCASLRARFFASRSLRIRMRCALPAMMTTKRRLSHCATRVVGDQPHLFDERLELSPTLRNCFGTRGTFVRHHFARCWLMPNERTRQSFSSSSCSSLVGGLAQLKPTLAVGIAVMIFLATSKGACVTIFI